jgi:hypothetical protein
MRSRLIFGVVAVAALLVLAGNSGADPDLSDVPDHRHWVANASGKFVQVGPRVCDNPDSQGVQKAFDQFHNNLHMVTPTGIGPAAPGLHNGKGGEIVPSGCLLLLG